MPNFKTNANHGTLYVAGFVTILGGGPTVTVPGTGRTYSGSTVQLDRLNSDIAFLKAAGWVVLADANGTTAQRPTDLENGGPLPLGFRYYDSTLTANIIWSGKGWINEVTGAAV